MQNGTPTPMINETMFTTTDSANNSVVSMRVPRHCRRHAIGSALAVIALTTIGHAEDQRAEWNKPQAPLRVFGNTYYVGPRGLSSILITSEAGHVLIDGALPESAAMIASHVRQLGFRMEDVRVILNSHAHFDHAGGIAELQRLSDARVVATAWSARVFEQGRSGPDDPQYGAIPGIAPAANVQIIADTFVARLVREQPRGELVDLGGFRRVDLAGIEQRLIFAAQCVGEIYFGHRLPPAIDIAALRAAGLSVCMGRLPR